MTTLVANGLDLANQRVQNLGDPSSPTDAVNRQWVENFIAGLAWKPAAKAASTGNVNIASPGASLDGVAGVVGDRWLLKDQTSGPTNGTYIWGGAAVPLVRASDMNTAAETRSATLSVEQGTVNADTIWVQTADNITLDTTALVFAQFKAGIAYTAAASGGLSLTGTAFAVVAGVGIVVGTTVAIDTAIVTRKSEALIGDGTTTTFVVTNPFGDRRMLHSVYDATTGQRIIDDGSVSPNTPFALTLVFAVAPPANSRRVVLHG